MKKDHFELARTFSLGRVGKSAFRVILLSGVLIGIYSLIIAFLAMRSS